MYIHKWKLLILGLLATTLAYAADFDGDTDNTFETPANWTGDAIPTTDAARIVTTGDNVTLASAQTTTGNLEIGAAGAGATLTVNAGGSLLTINRLLVGELASQTGTLNLNGGSVTALYDPTDNNHIGGFGHGVVNITDAASTLAGTQANIVLAFQPGGSGEINQTAGTVAMSGGNALVVGRAGAATYDQSGGNLSIAGTGDLVVGNNINGANGVYTLSGSATANVGDITTLAAGGNAQGTLNIGPGASFTTVDHLIMANGNNTIATVNLTGGSLTISGTESDLVIGNGGTGHFNQFGGTFNNTDVVQVGNTATGRGFLNLSGTAVFNTGLDELRVAQTLGSRGTMTMSDTATLNNGRALKVGTTDVGTLDMANSSQITGHSVIVGHNATGVGTMTMNDNTVVNPTTAATLVGNNGTGTLIMNNNASLTGHSISIGNGTTGTGDVTLNQNASVLMGSAQSNVGNNGSGTLTINDDATFTSGGNRSISIGNVNNGAGTVTVNDNGLLSSGGAMFLGQSGDATGTIVQNGGRVETRSSNLVVGRQANATGNYILNDGVVSAAFDLMVSRANSSVGNFTQADGQVIVGNNLTFGTSANASVGTYTMSGGTLTIANSMTAPAAGTFLLQGGTLRVDTLNANIDDFQWGAGTLASYQAADVRNIVSDIDLTTSTGSVLDLGAVYQSQSVIHETLTVNGTLDLNAADDALTAISSINLLRTLGHGSRAGRLDLVYATSILGEFDIFNGPTDAIISESLIDPMGNEDDLAINTYFLDYSTPGQITFLYKISNTVPEPSTVGLLGVSLVFLRGFARKRYRYAD